MGVTSATVRPAAYEPNTKARDALVAGCRARASGDRLPSVHMQTTRIGLSSASAVPGRGAIRFLVAASGLGSERQSDRECPPGDDAEVSVAMRVGQRATVT
jgi:hypothetical protein